MQVTDDQVAALRAFLVHDAEGMTRLPAELSNAGIAGYQYLAEAALTVIARRHFSPGYTIPDLIRFVAATRVARLADGDEYDFDPIAGENVLRSSLGQHAPRILDPAARFRSVIALLDALVDSELSDEADVDDLLAAARKAANQQRANGLA